MKTPLLYGLYLAVANFVLNLVLYLAGMHESVEGVQSVQWPAAILVIGFCATVIALAIRARRAALPGDAPWGYGSALGTGILVVLFSTVIGIFTTYVYYAFINPGMGDVMLQAQTAAMEARGMSATQVSQAEDSMRRFMTPLPMAIFGAFASFFIGTVVALITAAFFRERPIGSLPPPIV